MRTRNIFFMLKKIEKICLTLISSNYPSLEHIFSVPKVFEPFKLDYTSENPSITKMFLVQLEDNFTCISSNSPTSI